MIGFRGNRKVFDELYLSREVTECASLWNQTWKGRRRPEAPSVEDPGEPIMA